MLRHIVMWKFRPGTEAERDLFLTGLQGLYGHPGAEKLSGPPGYGGQRL